MRKHIDLFREFLEKQKMMEVIVSYDCSDKDDSFGGKIHDLLIDQYKSDFVTKSNYKIGRQLTFNEIGNLKQEIWKLFEECQSLNEGKREKRTIVSIITPHENQFIIDVIINE